MRARQREMNQPLTLPYNSLHFPTTPYTSLQLPTLPYNSLHFPTTPYTSLNLPRIWAEKLKINPKWIIFLHFPTFAKNLGRKWVRKWINLWSWSWKWINLSSSKWINFLHFPTSFKNLGREAENESTSLQHQACCPRCSLQMLGLASRHRGAKPKMHKNLSENGSENENEAILASMLSAMFITDVGVDGSTSWRRT